MILEDICTEKPDWDLISVYHDWLIDHDEPLKAEALMWLRENKRWMLRRWAPEKGFWFYIQWRSVKYSDMGETNWLPRAFHVFHEYEIVGDSPADLLEKYFKAYEMSREELGKYYAMKNTIGLRWVPAYGGLLT